MTNQDFWGLIRRPFWWQKKKNFVYLELKKETLRSLGDVLSPNEFQFCLYSKFDRLQKHNNESGFLKNVLKNTSSEIRSVLNFFLLWGPHAINKINGKIG